MIVTRKTIIEPSAEKSLSRVRKIRTIEEKKNKIGQDTNIYKIILYRFP